MVSLGTSPYTGNLWLRVNSHSIADSVNVTSRLATHGQTTTVRSWWTTGNGAGMLKVHCHV